MSLNLETSRVLIGTASFGRAYGIANKHTMQPSEIASVVREAAEMGYYGFDTAPKYGLAETQLNNSLGMKVFTKLSPEYQAPTTIRRELRSSIRNLGHNHIQGIAYHGTPRSKSSFRLSHAALTELKDSKAISEIGVSVYSPEELEETLNFFVPDYVQAPLNICDTRFLNSELAKQAKASGIRFHYRSIFLQGSFFMTPDSLRDRLPILANRVDLLQRISREADISINDLALSVFSRASEDDLMVIGVNSQVQLRNLTSSRVPFFETLSKAGWEDIEFDSEFDPRTW